MSYNGSGVYTLPGAQLANGATISATENNQFRDDVATALNVAWTRDGQAPATANIPMGNHKFTGLAAGTGAGDSVRYEQLPSGSNPLAVGSGGTGATTLTGLVKGNGTSAFTAASAGTDYQAAISATGLLKGAGSGSVSAAAAGTDYLAPAAIGTTVQAYSAELQGATQGGINGMKNRIINGAMGIWQRGTTFSSGVGASTYTADRFFVFANGAAVTVDQVTGPTGYKYAAKITGAASNTNAALYQRIESFNCSDLSGATVTISVTLSSSYNQNVGWALAYPTTPDNYASSTNISSGSWAVTSTASTFTATVTNLPSGALNGLQLIIGANSFGAFTSGTLTITGVQLEKGSTATSFDYRPYGTELALCQRYYFNEVDNVYSSGAAVANGVGGVVFAMTPVVMRAAPSVVITASANGSGFSPAVVGVKNIAIVYTSNGGGNGSAKYTASAEL